MQQFTEKCQICRFIISFLRSTLWKFVSYGWRIIYIKCPPRLCISGYVCIFKQKGFRIKCIYLVTKCFVCIGRSLNGEWLVVAGNRFCTGFSIYNVTKHSGDLFIFCYVRVTFRSRLVMWPLVFTYIDLYCYWRQIIITKLY